MNNQLTNPNALFAAILAAPLPTVRNAHLRQYPRTEWASAIRGLLRDSGIKTGVSITAKPRISSVHITLPSIDHDHTPDQWAKDCPHCQLKQRAIDHLDAMIVAAFPDLNDRSDYHTDYFNYCYAIS